MYGVPADLDLSHFKGATLTQVCVGEYQIQFHFYSSVDDKARPASISVEGKWEMRDAEGVLVDGCERTALPYSRRDAMRIHVLLLGKSVDAHSVNAPERFSLLFSSGYTLEFFDDSNQYESFSIQPGDVFV